jgi:NitT/TauT family transport system substrate-binding protein
MKLQKFRKGTVPIALALLILTLVACTNFWNNQANSSLPKNVAIAYQPSINYAPLMLVKYKETLEEQFPNINFQWKALAKASAIQEKMLANQLQVGAGDIETFLVGWDKGVGWKLLASLNHTDYWLVVKDPNINSLKDFKPGMKIGLSARDSIQAILLRLAAQKELGNPIALDKSIVEIPPNLGLQALQRGEIAGHFTTPPFQFQEVEKGGRVIFKSTDILVGKTSTANLFMTEGFYQQYPDFAKALYAAVSQATINLNEKPNEAAKVLENEGRSKVSRKQFKKWITNEALSYSLVPKGFLKQGQLMREAGILNKEPKSIEELILPTLHGVGGD